MTTTSNAMIPPMPKLKARKAPGATPDRLAAPDAKLPGTPAKTAPLAGAPVNASAPVERAEQRSPKKLKTDVPAPPSKTAAAAVVAAAATMATLKHASVSTPKGTEDTEDEADVEDDVGVTKTKAEVIELDKTDDDDEGDSDDDDGRGDNKEGGDDNKADSTPVDVTQAVVGDEDTDARINRWKNELKAAMDLFETTPPKERAANNKALLEAMPFLKKAKEGPLKRAIAAALTNYKAACKAAANDDDDDKENASAELQARFEDLTEQMMAKCSAFDALGAENKQHKAKYDSAIDVNKKWQTSYEELKKRADKHKETVTTHERTIKFLQSELAAMVAVHDGCAARIRDAAASSHTDCAAKISALEAQLKAAESRAFKDKDGNCPQTVNELLSLCGVLNAEISDLQKKQSESRDSLFKSLPEMFTVSLLKEENLKLRTAATEAAANYDSAIGKEREKQDILSKQIAVLKQQCEDREVQFSKLSAENTELQTQCATITAQARRLTDTDEVSKQHKIAYAQLQQKYIKVQNALTAMLALPEATTSSSVSLSGDTRPVADRDNDARGPEQSGHM